MSQSSPASDFQALINAVSLGDSTAAQNALTKLRSDFAAQGSRHGHHHHHGGWWSQSASSNNSASSSAVPAAVPATTDTDGDGQ